MIAKLKEDVPTLITVGDKVIKLYHMKSGGGGRVRIVADRDVVITCTHIAKTGKARIQGEERE